ncbi:RHS repeat-associated core domain-containing protein [Ferruginibacter sp.]|uniref:RHS repeat-associated core domain-containing protein n=1 Tax=Ferruginibacter sp. TaxID=1940288 RepID=UPI00349E60E8
MKLQELRCRGIPIWFNGKEKSDEIKGEGNSYNFTFRMYDPRLGRFLSVDPIAKNYPHSSPYAFAENDVIRSIDLEGLEKYIVTGRSFIPMATLTNPWYTPNFSATSFAGDNRMSYQLKTTAFRTEQKVNIDFDNRSITHSSNIASGTKALDKAGKVIETSDPAAAGPVPSYDKPFLQNANAATIHMSIDAPNKLVAGAPAINYQFDVTITPSADKKTFDYQIKGAADGFPAYELWITDETNNKSFLLFNRTPTETGETPRALFPPMEHKYNLKGNSSTKTPATQVKFSDTKNSTECSGEECK